MQICRPDNSGYHVIIDSDEISLASGTTMNRDLVVVPCDRIRNFTAPWQLTNLPSPVPKPLVARFSQLFNLIT